MKRLFKPHPGCRIIASAQHMTETPGTLLGWCEKVDGNICIFKPVCSDQLDRFIWRHSDGPNTWHEYAV